MEDIGRRWRKSSYSGNGGECVEVGQARDVIAVRDTRQDGARLGAAVLPGRVAQVRRTGKALVSV